MNKLFEFFKQIRWVNLLFLALVQYIVNRVFVLQINHSILFLCVVATLFIAAAGYLINDIQDLEIDKINLKNEYSKDNKFSIKSLHLAYILLNIFGLAIGFYLSYSFTWSLLVFFLLAIISLWLYAYFISKYKLIGNILISLLVVAAIILLPYLALFYHQYISISWQLIAEYSLFAFVLNWIREIVKDIEDQEGDSLYNRKTIPILFGLSCSKKILFIYIAGSILILFLGSLFTQTVHQIIFLLGFLVLALGLHKSKSKADFKFLSKLIKFLMFLGLMYPLIR